MSAYQSSLSAKALDDSLKRLPSALVRTVFVALLQFRSRLGEQRPAVLHIFAVRLALS